MSTINIHLVLTFLFTYRGYSYELYLYIQQKNKQKFILLLSARENERNFHSFDVVSRSRNRIDLSSFPTTMKNNEGH